MTAGFRTRRRGDIPYAPTSIVRSTWSAEDGQPLVYTRSNVISTLAEQVGHQELLTDVVTPNFRKLRAEGGIINNPMLRKVFDIKTTGADQMWAESPFYLDGTGGMRYDRWDGDMITAFSPGIQPPRHDEVLIQHLRSLASTAAYAGVEQPAVQGQVFIAELSKTMRMIARPASGLRDYILNSKKWRRTRNPVKGKVGKAYIRDVQRGTRESLTEGAAAAAASWNEGRFGWRPFLMEMDSILELLRKGATAPRKTSRASQTRTASKLEVMEQQAAIFGGQPSVYRADVHKQIVSTYTVRAGVLYDADLNLLEAGGLRWSDIPASAYELIPFSFVVDWFINLGDYISALAPKPATRYLASFTSVYVKHTTIETLQNVSSTLPGWGITIAPRGSRIASFEEWQRVPEVNRPSITFETDLTVALRSGRGYDALALLTQLVVGKYHRNQRKST